MNLSDVLAQLKPGDVALNKDQRILESGNKNTIIFKDSTACEVFYVYADGWEIIEQKKELSWNEIVLAMERVKFENRHNFTMPYEQLKKELGF